MLYLFIQHKNRKCVVSLEKGDRFWASKFKGGDFIPGVKDIAFPQHYNERQIVSSITQYDVVQSIQEDQIPEYIEVEEEEEF